MGRADQTGQPKIRKAGIRKSGSRNRTGAFSSLSSCRGQVAIILIFIIAIGLIFYAVSLNVGRVSAPKILVTKASNLMAARLASLMASYGEQVFQEVLGGKEEICDKTSAFQAIIMVVVFVVIIILAPAFAGMINAIAGGSLVTASMVATAATVAAVASAVSFALQVSVVQPAITKAWGEIIWENLEIVDQFMEQGIQTGLKNVVSDQVELPDIIDIDGDGKFGDLRGSPDAPDYMHSAPDYVSRFGWYYLERVKDIPPPPKLYDFPACLCALLYVDDNQCKRFGFEPADIPASCRSPEWGLYDSLECGARLNLWNGNHICCPGPPGRFNRPPNNSDHFQYPARCDPCCLPEFVPCPLPDRKADILCKVKCDMTRDDCPVNDYCAPRDEPLVCNGGIAPEVEDETQELIFLYGEPVRLAPACCYAINQNERCGDPTTCAQRSYLNTGEGQHGDGSTVYPYVFDPFCEKSINNDPGPGETPLISFREALGTDDFHRDYLVRYGFNGLNALNNIYSPNWHRYGGWASDQDEQYQISLDHNFHINDVDRLYGGARDIYPAFRDNQHQQGLFTIRDTSGFYRPLIPGEDGQPVEPVIYNAVPDQKRGIFPFLYKMADWGIELKKLTYGFNYAGGRPQPPWQQKDDYQCFWCDLVRTNQSQSPFYQDCPVDHYEDLDQIDELTHPDFRMQLTFGPADNVGDLGPVFTDPRDEDWCMDRENPGRFEAEGTTIVADSVKDIPKYDARPAGGSRPDLYTPLWPAGQQYPFFNEEPFENQETCALTEGGWRRGLDWYCDQETGPEGYPYLNGCPKNGGYHQCSITGHDQEFFGDVRPEEVEGDPLYDAGQFDCPCETDDLVNNENVIADAQVLSPEHFPEDRLDLFIQQSDAFINWAEKVLFIPLKRLSQTVEDWYVEAADWIEPGCQNADNCPGSYTNKERIGMLWQWKETLKYFKDPIEEWLTRSHREPGDDLVWCVPPEERDECAPGDELATRDDNGNATIDDVEDVIGCLNWQVKDEMEFSKCPEVNPPTVVLPEAGMAVGNAQKFQACRLACGRDALSGGDYKDFAICKDLPRALDSRICIIRENRTDESAGRPTGPNSGFEPPFNRPEWEACQLILVSGRPSDPAEVQSWVDDCNTLCGGLNFCPYDEFGYWPEDLFFNPANLDVQSLLDTLQADDLGLLDPPLTYEQRQAILAEIDSRIDLANYGSCEDPEFIGAIEDILSYIQNDGLNDCDPESIFMQALINSEKWAYGQVDKYKYRAWFLQNRVNEAKHVFKTLDDAYFQLTNFLIGYRNPGDRNSDEDPIDENDLLNGVFGNDEMQLAGLAPAEQLIWTRSHLEHNPEKRQLASVAIYVWRDEPIPVDRPPRAINPDGSENRLGYVHAVKVEARIPERCNAECEATRWPYVETEEHTLERCYYLAETQGKVKARVIRYDQNPDAYQNPRFPDGTKIWQPRFTHPRSGHELSGVADSIFDGVCNHEMTVIPLLKLYDWWDNSAWGDHIDVVGKEFGHAMMLNRVPGTPGVAPDYGQCWNRVHQLLEHGVVTDTCAEYYFSRGEDAGEGGFFRRTRGALSRAFSQGFYGKKGFKMRFIKCDKAFLAGLN